MPPSPLSLAWRVGDVRIEVSYVGSPCPEPGKPFELAVALQNLGLLATETTIAVKAPEDWPVATKLGVHRLEPGERIVRGLVAQPTDTHKDQSLTLTLDGNPLSVPVLARQRWWTVGPFDNPSGNAFLGETPPEKAQTRGTPFSGRSGLAARWEEWPVEGHVLQVEPLFRGGAGVVALWARVRLPKPGKYRLVAAGSPGVVAKVDGQRLVAYVDTHVPVARDKAPYSADFRTEGECTIFLKLIRDIRPFSALSVYLLSEEGIVAPSEWLDMPQ